jgi:hypothetical protein
MKSSLWIGRQGARWLCHHSIMQESQAREGRVAQLSQWQSKKGTQVFGLPASQQLLRPPLYRGEPKATPLRRWGAVTRTPDRACR